MADGMNGLLIKSKAKLLEGAVWPLILKKEGISVKRTVLANRDVEFQRSMRIHSYGSLMRLQNTIQFLIL